MTPSTISTTSQATRPGVTNWGVSSSDRTSKSPVVTRESATPSLDALARTVWLPMAEISNIPTYSRVAPAAELAGTDPSVV